MKTLRDYINLIETAQQGVSEGDKKPHPKTWHDVDPKLGKQVDKMSQAEKVKKGLAHPDTLKKKDVAEGSGQRVEIIGGPEMYVGKTGVIGKMNQQHLEKYPGHVLVNLDGRSGSVMLPKNAVKKQGVAEGSLEEYGDTTKGQKQLAKVHKRAVDRVTSKQADTDPKYAKKNQDTANASWERLKDKD